DYSIYDIASGKLDDQFFTYTGLGGPNYGYTNAAYWVRFQVKNNSEQKHWILEMKTPKINRSNLYYFDQGKYEKIQIGNAYRFNDRPVNHRNLVYTIEIDQGASKEFYLRLTSGGAMQIPLSIKSNKEF